MKTVAFVPIKQNSERLPNKNFLFLGDKPLFMYIIETLCESELIDEVYIFSNADFSYYSLPVNVKILERDYSLDLDIAKGIDIYTEFANKVSADIYVLSHATAPFVTVSSINKSIELIKTTNYDSVFSARCYKTYAWYRNKPLNFELSDIQKTQDLEAIYLETSGLYVFRSSVILRGMSRVGVNPFILEVGEKESIDIDYEEDFLKAVKYL
jgi:CMP-N-acetylneuraminic acid synthetase